MTPQKTPMAKTSKHQAMAIRCQVAETCNGHSPLQDIVQLLLLPVNAQSTTLAKRGISANLSF